jgi:hypothetical protein
MARDLTSILSVSEKLTQMREVKFLTHQIPCTFYNDVEVDRNSIVMHVGLLSVSGSMPLNYRENES